MIGTMMMMKHLFHHCLNIASASSALPGENAWSLLCEIDYHDDDEDDIEGDEDDDDDDDIVVVVDDDDGDDKSPCQVGCSSRPCVCMSS